MDYSVKMTSKRTALLFVFAKNHIFDLRIDLYMIVKIDLAQDLESPNNGFSSQNHIKKRYYTFS